MTGPADYPQESWESHRNAYGDPVIVPQHFRGLHYPAYTPANDSTLAVCSCGWTHDPVTQMTIGDHLSAMGPAAL